MINKQLKIITILSLALAFFLGIVSYYGIFIPGTYERETASLAAQGRGQDLVDLFFILPLLILSLIFMLNHRKTAYFVYSGTVLYILYSFVIYSLGIHFNQLFLLYCLTLGLSLYAFILILNGLNSWKVKNWFGDKILYRSTAIFLLIIAVMFYLLWFKEIIPAIVNNTIPNSVSDYDLLVNPVHVMDIAIVLPGLIITALLLIRKHQLGYILTPIFLVFIINLAVALTGMVIMVKESGISDDSSLAVIFMVLAIISGLFLFLFLKNLKKTES